MLGRNDPTHGGLHHPNASGTATPSEDVPEEPTGPSPVPPQPPALSVSTDSETTHPCNDPYPSPAPILLPKNLFNSRNFRPPKNERDTSTIDLLEAVELIAFNSVPRKVRRASTRVEISSLPPNVDVAGMEAVVLRASAEFESPRTSRISARSSAASSQSSNAVVDDDTSLPPQQQQSSDPSTFPQHQPRHHSLVTPSTRGYEILTDVYGWRRGESARRQRHHEIMRDLESFAAGVGMAGSEGGRSATGLEAEDVEASAPSSSYFFEAEGEHLPGTTLTVTTAALASGIARKRSMGAIREEVGTGVAGVPRPFVVRAKSAENLKFRIDSAVGATAWEEVRGRVSAPATAQAPLYGSLGPNRIRPRLPGRDGGSLADGIPFDVEVRQEEDEGMKTPEGPPTPVIEKSPTPVLSVKLEVGLEEMLDDVLKPLARHQSGADDPDAGPSEETLERNFKRDAAAALALSRALGREKRRKSPKKEESLDQERSAVISADESVEEMVEKVELKDEATQTSDTEEWIISEPQPVHAAVVQQGDQQQAFAEKRKEDEVEENPADSGHEDGCGEGWDDISIFDDPIGPHNLKLEVADDQMMGISRDAVVYGTPEKLVQYLTLTLDNSFVMDFFLTYRYFMTSMELLRLLALRLKWAMIKHEDDERKVVRIRTFVVLRYWIKHYWAEDFTPAEDAQQFILDLIELVLVPFIETLGNVTDIRIVTALKQLIADKTAADYPLAEISNYYDDVDTLASRPSTLQIPKSMSFQSPTANHALPLAVSETSPNRIANDHQPVFTSTSSPPRKNVDHPSEGPSTLSTPQPAPKIANADIAYAAARPDDPRPRKLLPPLQAALHSCPLHLYDLLRCLNNVRVRVTRGHRYRGDVRITRGERYNDPGDTDGVQI
ncbi:Guanine nucleotide exchange factor lte1, partial [Irineochytrium annulatum]